MRHILVEKISVPHEIVFNNYSITKKWLDKKGLICRYNIKENNNPNISIDYFFKNGVLHRDYDEPAVFDNGIIKFYKNGKLHRGLYEPAVINSNGTLSYYVHGDLRFETKK